MGDHIRIEPQPQIPEGGWEIHSPDATGMWFRPRTSNPYPMFHGPDGTIHFFCTEHNCWEWITPPCEATVHQACLEAIEKSIAPLTNAAELFGFGESFVEAMDALALCLTAVDSFSALCARAGVETPGSGAYPKALYLFKHHSYPRRKGAVAQSGSDLPWPLPERIP